MQRAELNASSKDGGDFPVIYAIIANFNYSEFLLDCLNSIVNQDYPKVGISLCDDCSTDDSVSKVLRHLEGKRVVTDNEEKKVYEGFYVGTHMVFTCLKRNGHQARARNHAIGAVAGLSDYFGIVDADDQIRPSKFRKCIEKIEMDKGAIGAAYTDYSTLRPESGLLIREFKQPYSYSELRRECIVHSGCVISKLALQTIGLFDEEVSPVEDYNLWLRLSKRFIIVHIPEDLVLVKVHPKNCSNSVSQERWNVAYKLAYERGF